MSHRSRSLVLVLVLLVGAAVVAPAAAQGDLEPRAVWDDFAQAWAFTPPYSDVDDTTWTTVEASEPPTSCGGSDSHSVWYVYTPPANAQITADTFGSDYDTVLAVYRNNWFTEVACSDDAGGATQSQVTFAASGGSTYYFRISDYGVPGTGGWVHFNVTSANPGPTNDNFASAQAAGTFPTWQQGTWNATTEPGEPLSCNDGGWVSAMGATVWYTLTVTAPTLVTVDTFGSDFDTSLSVYTGGSVGSLTMVVCDEDTNGLRSLVQFAAVPGTVYRLQVGGYDGAYDPPATGNLKLNITRDGWPTCLGWSATRVGTSADNTINGTAGDDVIVGLGGNDTLNGLGGNDRICGRAGRDNIQGGLGNDRVSGGTGRDVIWGGDGADTLKGGAGADQVSGDAGNDKLFGQAGNDTLNGGTGTDTVTGGAGTDACSGETMASCP